MHSQVSRELRDVRSKQVEAIKFYALSERARSESAVLNTKIQLTLAKIEELRSNANQEHNQQKEIDLLTKTLSILVTQQENTVSKSKSNYDRATILLNNSKYINAQLNKKRLRLINLYIEAEQLNPKVSTSSEIKTVKDQFNKQKSFEKQSRITSLEAM